MGAFVEYESNSGFLINEEKIRKIYKIICEGFKDAIAANKINLTIYRSDSFFYTTTDLEDLINEDNIEYRKITALEITVKSSNQDFKEETPTSLSLVFSKPRQRVRTPEINFYLQGEDRNFVFVLGSDIKKYLDNEIKFKTTFNVFHLLNRFDRSFGGGAAFPRWFFSLYFFLLFIGLFITAIPSLILALTDDQRFAFIISITLGALFLLFILSSSYLFPNCLFLFGKEKSRYNRILSIRSNIFWVVFVGLVISIIGGIIMSAFGS